MSSVSHRENNNFDCYSIVYFIVLFIVCIITIPSYIYPYFSAFNFEETQCYIENVLYPTSIPTFENYDNWMECDSGRQCTTFSPCIKLYSNISSEFIKNIYPSYDNVCTFHESRCITGYDIRNVHAYLNESRQMYKEYINTTQTCYINPNNNEIYLENITSFKSMLTSIIILSLMLLSFLGFILYYKIQYVKNN